MLTYQPSPGTIVICDFNGFNHPEMVKKRPVVIFAKSNTNPKLVTIVPISTTEPHEITDLHVEVEGPLDGKRAWVKCDMITTICIDRLDRINIKRGNKTEWGTKQLNADLLNLVFKGVAKSLGLQHTE